MSLRLILGLAVIAILTLGLLMPLMLADRLTSVTATSPTHTEPSLRTRKYLSEPDLVRIAIEASIPRLSTYGRNWKLVTNLTEDVPVGVTIIRAEVPVFVFIDDLEVTLQPENGYTKVDVRSASRVGKYDFGENRRHILQLLEELDQKFERPKE